LDGAARPDDGGTRAVRDAGCRILWVQIRKRAIDPLPPAIEWEIELQLSSDASGSVVLDTSGK
jgi:hypothetical protein